MSFCSIAKVLSYTLVGDLITKNANLPIPRLASWASMEIQIRQRQCHGPQLIWQLEIAHKPCPLRCCRFYRRISREPQTPPNEMMTLSLGTTTTTMAVPAMPATDAADDDCMNCCGSRAAETWLRQQWQINLLTIFIKKVIVVADTGRLCLTRCCFIMNNIFNINIVLTDFVHEMEAAQCDVVTCCHYLAIMLS